MTQAPDVLGRGERSPKRKKARKDRVRRSSARLAPAPAWVPLRPPIWADELDDADDDRD